MKAKNKSKRTVEADEWVILTRLSEEEAEREGVAWGLMGIPKLTWTKSGVFGLKAEIPQGLLRIQPDNGKFVLKLTTADNYQILSAGHDTILDAIEAGEQFAEQGHA